ncbi:hypothetical protein CYY_007606 [Polysphondylium violaceum]|uniref:Uncharacterized protein n=1 Tax=Polysphondylium violaceum TaxID=133409 RepID=A0A8J4V4S3_9MYCE|nr:hypothetical protein CYY_007606 [Polysphondylium violaceum]
MVKILNILLATIVFFAAVAISVDLPVYTNSGYSENIINDSLDAHIEESTDCREGMEKCIKATTLTDNGFYGFKLNDTTGFNSADSKYIEANMFVEYNGDRGQTVIWTSVQTVSKPARAYLNETWFVSGNLTEGWQFVRVKLSTLNVEAATFNSFRFGASLKNTTIYIGEIHFTDAPTSLEPLGYVDNSSSSLMINSLFVFVLPFLFLLFL